MAGALISVNIGAMVWHGRFGLTVLGLLVFRLTWGVIGSTYARFSSFVTGPSRLFAYLRGHYHPLGHTPLGALSILAMLLVLGFQVTSGLFATDDIAFSGPLGQTVSSAASAWLTGWHRRTEWVIYGLIALHISAVLYYSLLRKNSIIRPMIGGTTVVVDPATSRPAEGGGPVAFFIALLITAAVLYIALGGLLAPPAPPPPDLGW